MIYVDATFFEHPQIWEARDIPYVAVHPSTRFDFFRDVDVVVSETPAGVSSVTEVTQPLLDSWKKQEANEKADARADKRLEIEKQRQEDGGVPRLNLEDLARNSNSAAEAKEAKEKHFSTPRPPTEMGDLGAPVIMNDSGFDPIEPDLTEPNQSLDG